MQIEQVPSGNLLKQAREEARLSQSELAERINTTQSVVSDFEQGKRSSITVAMLLKISDVTGKPLDFFI